MEGLALDFAPDDARAGYRLHRVEVYNWGTFDGHVWRLTPEGANSLVTGDIGSGKSTLVDAITTLLVPAQRITYNKAAGAEARERSLRSYVLGHYKSQRSDSGLSARPVALRDHNSYSVILGHFYNEGFDRHVTLAQVFWVSDSRGQPDRFYITADRPLSISEHFSGFGNDLKDLRKQLRALDHVELHTAFPAYGSALRRKLGIASDQALELFNQTVSMKSVGNLTEFVREHMLQGADTDQRIDELIRHFDDLNRAHAAVLKARDQIEALTPIVSDADDHAERSRQADELRGCRDALSPWFAGLKIDLLDRRLEELTGEQSRLTHRVDEFKRKRSDQQGQRDELKQAIAANGGDRLERIREEIQRRHSEKSERRRQAERYRELATALDLPNADNADTFISNRAALKTLHERTETEQAEGQNARTELFVSMKELRGQHAEIDSELESLKARRSNLPAAMLALRDKLCQALGLPPEELPFAGELIQVRDDEKDWEGAIERLLHNFALSLLVPDAHYRAVADWVDTTRLRGRLVYYRVREPKSASPERAPPEALSRKLSIRTDSAHYAWLEQELTRRFDHICCSDMDRFRRETRAITRSGQVKSGGVRHEKDDRHAIDDRTRYVLGWSNENKIRALSAQSDQLEKRIQAVAAQISEVDKLLKTSGERLETISRLDMFEDHQHLNWQEAAARISALESEERRLRDESDVLKTLRAQLDELEQARAEVEAQLEQRQNQLSTIDERIRNASLQRDEAASLLDELDPNQRAQWFRHLEAWREQALPGQAINLNGIDARQREYRAWLTARIDTEDKAIRRLSDRLIQAMQNFHHRWPQEAREADTSVAAVDEYRRMLTNLKGDDLPRFEARFKTLLNENTINEIAGFQALLNREREQIRERIDTINRSLEEIDYEKGRYIRLLAETAPDADVRDFQHRLRACTEGTVTGSDDAQYSEQKFLQVRDIIDRFRGREGTAELDRRWTRKVTDVRNWFVFSASERWREDDREHEHYADSGGKSGGQKEKLAYTVLAASLAYQFGLEWGEKRSRSFRFVVIDEAFGRGSDESARYGLSLFGRLNLQLLIVTPLQKIHIIEPFVASVGFVHNPEGKKSMLRNLSIEEYRAERAERESNSVTTMNEGATR
ncbi:MAG: ATP-dependent exonuclease SbcCD, C subunit-like protein [Wenzhouxiangella sp.]|nr:ATP-dependent exonuclease SbcCD, C subunit-like protein [Wenzhouxiangella sp.]